MRVIAVLFLSLHFTAQHWPWEGANDQEEAVRLDAHPHPFSIIHHDGGNLDTYAEMVASLDQNVSRVLQRPDELGIAENTIVVFTSDNGGERYSDTLPLTGMTHFSGRNAGEFYPDRFGLETAPPPIGD